MRTFSERCKGKKLVCYGIGHEFEKIIKNYEGYDWINTISFLVDSNTLKQGQLKKVGEKEFEILSLAKLLHSDMKDVILLITSVMFGEIYERLHKIRELENVECYIYHFMFTIGEGKYIQIRQTLKPLIPKKIHYCWFGGGELPELYKRCIESWKRHCPDYSIERWDETNCNINETTFTKQAYHVGKMGFVPDYFRLKIIYEHGGIYLDTDVEVLKNLDDFLYNHAFCGLEQPGEVNFGLGFGAYKGNELLLKLMKRYMTMPFIEEDGKFNEIASPIYQTMDFIKEGGVIYGNRLQKVCGMTIYPTEVLSPKNCVTEEYCISDNSYTIHHYDGSWVDGELLKGKMRRLATVKTLQEQFDVN